METAVQIPRQEACEACKGSGAAAGTSPTVCPQCGGRGQIRYQQGFFTVAQTCRQCGGAGRVITKACPECRGHGHVARAAQADGPHPGRASRAASGSASTARAKAGRRGGPPGDLYVVVHVQDHPVFRREGDDLFCRVPITFPIVALGGEIPVPTLTGPEKLDDPGGHPERPGLPAAGQGDAERVRAAGAATCTSSST